MTLNDMMNKLFSANGKLETAQTTASHLYNMIGNAKTDAQEDCAVFFHTNQNTILALLSVIIDYINDANTILDEVQNADVTENI